MVVLVTCLAMASLAGAATLITGPTGTTIGGSVFIPSTNVTISAISISTNYCATAQNSSSDTNKGGKQYGTTSGGSTLKVAPSIAPTTAAPTACTDASTLPAQFI